MNSSRTRSAETISSVAARSVIAARTCRGDVEAELGREARRPHHPQRVVGEGLLGGGGRHESPGGEVVETAVHVDELEARQPDRHRVDGEVAAHEVTLEACRRT